MRTIISMAAAAILFTTPLLAAERPHVCQRVVDAELSRVGVSPDAISSTRIERDYDYSNGRGDPQLVGYSYWIKMKSCQKGYLMVTLHDNCLPMGAPATVYGCQVAGVKQC